MTTIVTGAAGFIGFHVVNTLLARDETVIGLDNVNDYYDVALKEARLAQLEADERFTLARVDIADRAAVAGAVEGRQEEITGIIHLAAQAGVRYSLINPYAYVESNLMGQVVILELCRSLPHLRHLVYASSSSVYGGCRDVPFSLDARVDEPVSLYAATKKADELMGHVYSHLYGVPATGLRFFTVYGPWGRPDMAAYIFTKAIFDGTPIQLFNAGDMKRDFTYVGDVAPTVVRVLDKPPANGEGRVPHKVYNLGNSRSEDLTRYVAILEEAIGKKAIIEHAPMQPGDVKETWADISEIQRDHGFEPSTPIEEGLPRFVAWYRAYHGA